MAQFIIKWDAGCGRSYEVVEADSPDDADQQAYERWNEEVRSYGQYWAEETTAIELLELGEYPPDYGVEVTIEDVLAVGYDPIDYGFEDED